MRRGAQHHAPTDRRLASLALRPLSVRAGQTTSVIHDHGASLASPRPLTANTRDRFGGALVNVGVVKTIAAVALALLVGPVAVAAQPTRQLYRIGVLFTEAVNPPTLGVLRQGLKDLGIDDGTRVVVLARTADGARRHHPFVTTAAGGSDN